MLPTIAGDPLRQFRILFRYRRDIAITLAAVVLIALVSVFVVTPSYRGSATMLIEPVGAKVVAIDEVYQPNLPGFNLTEYQNTQLEVLRSRMIAERVFDTLKLETYPEYASAAAGGDAGMLAKLASLFRKNEGDASARGAAIEDLMDNLHVVPVISSNLVKVHADSEDPELSAKIANAVVGAFLAYEKETRGGIAGEASGWLGERLAEVKADLERAENALQKFYESEQLVNVGGARGLVEDEITDNAQRLREASSTRTSLENVYRRIVSGKNNVAVLQEIPQIAQEPLVQTTKRLFLEAQSEVGSLQARYGAKHPKMIAAQARLADARDALKNQVLLAADGIRSQYEIARNTEASLSGIVETSRSQILGLDRKGNEQQILQREVESNRKLYDTILQRSKETEITGELDIGKVRIVEPAMVPTEPFKPRKALWIATAVLLGLFLGLSLALVRGYLDDTIKTPLDLEQAALIPALTVLPRTKSIDQPGPGGEDVHHAAFSEGVRTLRTSLLLADVSRRRKRVLVTSALPGEGKTSIAINLALAIGQVERVLLIDADMRRPTVATRLGIEPGDRTIVEFVTGARPESECIHRHAASGIDVLPCGKPPPNPLELVSSERFAQMLDRVADNYDRIVIDSPPCVPVSDSLLLSRLTDAVIFLVKADSTPRAQVASAVNSLRQSGAPLIGAVLNEADTQRQSGFGYGYYYYQGGYGGYKATT
jgi:polysaccharide biosynthesis transport protein